MTAKPKGETERRRLAKSIEKLEDDLAALRAHGGLSPHCAECPQGCCGRIEGEIERARARLRELTEGER